MNINRESIVKLVNEIITDRPDLFVTEVKVKPDNTIYIFLDGDHGVQVDDCIKVSKFVESRIDRNRFDFELNVSSFGIGRPLQCFRQFQNAVGKMMSVKFADGSKVKGILVSCSEKQIQLKLPGTKKQPDTQRDIFMDEIKEAKIEISF